MKREEKNGNGKSLPLAAPAFTAHLIALETRLKVDCAEVVWAESSALDFSRGENKTRFTAYSVIKDINLKRSWKQILTLQSKFYVFDVQSIK